jgi:hypothetical protein
MFRKLRKISPIARAIAVMGATGALVTGVTFAALQNTATLTDNTITSTTDGLLVDSDGDNTFAPSDEGFDFVDVDPGTTSDAKAFKLKNATDGPLDINVQVMGEEPLPAGVDPTDITFHFDTNGDAAADVSATWAEIINGTTDGVPLNLNLDPNEVADVTVAVEIDASVSDDVTITAFNFVFGDSDLEEL